MSQKMRLVLEDGTVFEGRSFGAERAVTGEVVFNTGMVGYPETLTDPSYRVQILVMTYPMIGNYGVPEPLTENSILKNYESDQIQITGLVVSEYSTMYSHWSAKRSLQDWLKAENIPAIDGIDTRALTQKIRTHGTMVGKLVTESQDIELKDPNLENLVAQVGTKEVVEYARGKKRVVLIDCGVKNNIIHAFLRRDISVIRVPWDYDFTTLPADGVLVSNGPGDPKMCPETIEHVRKHLKTSTPLLGICLGSQILGLAAGADTYKLKFGHRSQNQPCNEMGTRRCYITSQNHGYAIDSQTMPLDWREWFYNDNDGTNEGLLHISRPFFGTQFHPEASPGPDDTEFVFDMFIRAIE